MITQIAGIVGGGLMGTGIATKFALAGYETILHETVAARRAHLPVAIRMILQELIEAGAINEEESEAAMGRIQLTGHLTSLREASIVIDAIPEVLVSKQTLYRDLEALVAADALIASNTSGFMPDVLSESMSYPERFLITHFWNPPHAIPLVEVVPGRRTNPAFVDRAVKMLRKIHAEPVVLHKAIPGFIGNRLQFAILREALHLLRAGVADAETIDTVMKTSLGRRYGIMGPLESADLGGLETIFKVATHLMPELAKDEDVLDVLKSHTENGEDGVSTGVGFYSWTEERKQVMRKKRITCHLRKPVSSD